MRSTRDVGTLKARPVMRRFFLFISDYSALYAQIPASRSCDSQGFQQWPFAYQACPCGGWGENVQLSWDSFHHRHSLSKPAGKSLSLRMSRLIVLNRSSHYCFLSEIHGPSIQHWRGGLTVTSLAGHIGHWPIWSCSAVAGMVQIWIRSKIFDHEDQCS